MRKLASLLIVILAAATSNTGVAFAARHQCTRPFTGSGSGTDTIPVVGGSTFLVDGTVNTSPLGAGTFHSQGTQNGPTTFTFTTTTVYARGTLRSSASGTDTGPNTSTSVTTVTGGTGRFVGATGSTTVTATTSPTPDPQVRTVTLTFTGTITLRKGPHCNHGGSDEHGIH